MFFGRSFFLVLIGCFVFHSASFGQEVKQKIAIVVSVYNDGITERLLEAAVQCLYKNGLQLEDISIAYVPGSYEIPYAAKLLAQTQRFDAIICLGAITTANNPQSNLLADHVSKNISQISLFFSVPITWGIYLFDNQQDALQAVNELEKNHGWEAAQAAVAMIGLTKQIQKFAQSGL